MQFSEILIFAEKLYFTYGLPVVFVASMLETTPLGWIVPGGILLILGGFFAYGRPYYLLTVIVVGWIGAWFTFVAAYLLGAGAAKKLNINLRENKNARRAKVLLKSHGPAILTTAMLASITRFWIAFAVGASEYKMSKFLFYSGIASLAWTSLMVVIGFLAGSERERLESLVASLGIIAWFIFFLVAGVFYSKIRKEFKQFK